SAPYATLIRRLTTTATSQAIGLTSCAHAEGVSTVAANLAVAAAGESARPVLLIDTDFAQSPTQSMFGLAPGPGFVDALSGETKLPECIRWTSIPNLHLMGPGAQAVTLGAAGGPATFHSLIEILKLEYSWVLFDLPIVSECHFPTLISNLDGLLLVVEAERLRRQVVMRAKEQLENNDAKVLGVVFNKRQHHVPNWIYNRV
ncbi:MAG: CpsD/CapB family tyrosine-protein kinase, partial [Pirellulaceae bacterium]|nr:CpsD/CapB family tyrosine-protein kinase [Pirellulaceae bacterium]